MKKFTLRALSVLLALLITFSVGVMVSAEEQSVEDMAWYSTTQYIIRFDGPGKGNTFFAYWGMAGIAEIIPPLIVENWDADILEKYMVYVEALTATINATFTFERSRGNLAKATEPLVEYMEEYFRSDDIPELSYYDYSISSGTLDWKYNNGDKKYAAKAWRTFASARDSFARFVTELSGLDFYMEFPAYPSGDDYTFENFLTYIYVGTIFSTNEAAKRDDYAEAIPGEIDKMKAAYNALKESKPRTFLDTILDFFYTIIDWFRNLFSFGK